MAKNKTDNFLKAIKKYANAQKSAMRGEVKQLKTERLKEAEEKAKAERDSLVKTKLTESRSRQTALLATKTQEAQRNLFVERIAMTDEVFKLAAEKLDDYTKTDAYSARLTESAKEIAALFGDKDCVLYLNERDLDKADELSRLFSGSTEVQADKTIKIGGVKGYCESMGIIADETLDSKLEAQRDWFSENAELSVI